MNDQHDQTSAPATKGTQPKSVPQVPTNLTGGNISNDTQSHAAPGQHSATTPKAGPKPTECPASSHPSTGDHHASDTQGRPVSGQPSASPAKDGTTPNRASPVTQPLTGGQKRPDTHWPLAPGQPLAPSNLSRDTQDQPARGVLLAADQMCSDTQGAPVGGDHPAGSQSWYDTHFCTAPGTLSDDGQEAFDTHGSSAVVGPHSSSHPSTIQDTKPTGHPSTDGWLELRIWAEQYEDAQQARIAAVNRAERGGVDPVVYSVYIEALRSAENICRLHLLRCYRRVVPAPIVRWQKQTPGIGEHLLARLLGHLGHPVWTIPHHWEGTGSNRVLVTDPPFERTVSQLRQFCGHGAPGRAKKGATAEELAALGNPKLKMLTHLCAEACMKARSSPFRLVYEQTRIAVADKLHSTECARCGPSGKPAQPGTPWSAGHQHAHALRIVGKELLRDLWIVAGGGQAVPDNYDVDASPGDPSRAGGETTAAPESNRGPSTSGSNPPLPTS